MKRINSFVLSILIAAGILLCFMPLVNQSVYADDETVTITLHASSIEGDDWVDPIVIEAPKGTSYGDALTNYGNAHPEMNAEWAVNKSPFKKEGYSQLHVFYDNLHHTKSFTESTAYKENRIAAGDKIFDDIDVYVWHDILLNRVTIKRPICGTVVSHTSDPYEGQINAPQLVYSEKIVDENPAIWIQGPDNATEEFQGTIEGGKTYYAFINLKLKSDIGYQFDYNKMTIYGGKLVQWRMTHGEHIIFIASTEASHIWGETKYTWGKDDKTVTASRPCTICGDKDSEAASETADVVVTEKPATCTEDGVKIYTAEFANPDFKTQEKTFKTEDAHGHKWDAGKVTKAATTSATGVKTYKCATCGATRKETIPKINPSVGLNKSLPKERIKKTAGLKKAATVKWTKLSSKNSKKIQGIEVQIATNKAFTKNVKIKTAKKTASSIKIKKLKSRKTYWVRVRTYKMVSGGEQFSTWSKAKSVKIK